MPIPIQNKRITRQMSINIKATHQYLLDKFEEHNRCCQYTMEEINSWLSQLLFIYYFMSVPLLDMGFIFLIFEKKSWARFVGTTLLLLIGVNMFIFNYFLTRIGLKAHQSYQFLNSLMATKNLSLRVRFKCLDVIERLAGPQIGIYCLDLFAFTNDEFHLFIVNCVSGFTLLVDTFFR